MNIVVLQDFLRSGGTERQSLLLTQAFAAAGHRATLLTFRPGGALSPAEVGMDCRALQPFDTGLDWFAPGLVRTIRALAPDVLLCMGRMANCYGGRLQAHLPRTAVIATMRTGKTLPWLFRRSLRRVRHIVANCREAKETLTALHGLPSERISVIYNSLVFPATTGGSTGRSGSASASAPEQQAVRLPTRNEALRTEIGAGPDTTVLLCVAMFRPEKNQRALIEIAAGLPADLDWQLWLAGDGPARPACERFAAQCRAGSPAVSQPAVSLSNRSNRPNPAVDRIKFLGWQRDPTPLYAAADIAVHASESESLSNFLIEAQAHGLPAVAYYAQGIAECFVPGDTGFVIPRDDPAAFRARLAALAGEDSAARTARSVRAQAYARATFDRSRQVVAYLELFQKLVPAPTP